MGEADDEDEDSDESEDDDEAMKDEFKYHLKAEGEMSGASGGSLILGGANSGQPATLSVVEGTNEITGEPTRVEFDPSQPLTTDIMGGKSNLQDLQK